MSEKRERERERERVRVRGNENRATRKERKIEKKNILKCVSLPECKQDMRERKMSEIRREKAERGRNYYRILRQKIVSSDETLGSRLLFKRTTESINFARISYTVLALSFFLYNCVHNRERERKREIDGFTL